MALLAKRVRLESSPVRMTSRSETPWARAASRAISKMRGNSLRIGGPDFYFLEARGGGAVAGAHDLLGLAFAAVGDAPEGPVVAAGDGRAGVPKLSGDAAVAGIL